MSELEKLINNNFDLEIWIIVLSNKSYDILESFIDIYFLQF